MYLLGKDPNPTTAGSARNNAQEREQEERREKSEERTRGTDALMGDEEQRKTEKKNKKEWNRGREPYPATLDHSVASYNPHGSYSEPTPLTKISKSRLFNYLNNCSLQHFNIFHK